MMSENIEMTGIMTIDEAKQLLEERGFRVVEGVLQIGDIVKEPLIAVKVSEEHGCFDDWCRDGMHPVATATSIKKMERVAFEALVFEELEGNR